MANIYPPCQCTWWCYETCPWLAPYGNLGNAMDWAGNAAAKGLHVSPTPAVGTVICLQPGIDGASNFGHVAVVVNVTGTNVTVTQMDVPVGNCASTMGHYAAGPGVSFIYPPGMESDEMNIAAVEWPAQNSQHVFQGVNNALYHKWWTPGHGWQNEIVNLGEALGSNPPVTALIMTGQLHVFTQGADNYVLHGYQNAVGQGWNVEKLP